ncbi:hypothetical protein G6F50_013720 [Rhizopus delemar]|uniref:Uncharacterized protein n=1 Tax=Rhizopus delemar TaxID=936053 RepID=A0A9P6YEE1_9FUNG|nr:hypothetical protein G6F50_013720 [Rhizopus delemar]
MHHRGADAPLEVLHLRHEIGMRVALVQEQWLSIVCGQLQLAFERAVLGGARREITEVVQPALAHRHYFRMGMQRAHLGVALFGVLHRVMRVHAGGGIQKTRMLLRQLQGQRRVLAAGAGDHHLHHAGLARAVQHGVTGAVEGVVGQVGADIDQVHGHRGRKVPAHCTCARRGPLSFAHERPALPDLPTAATDPAAPGRTAAAGAGSPAGRRQDHPGAAGAAGCAVAAGAEDHPAGTEAGGRTQRGAVHGAAAG